MKEITNRTPGELIGNAYRSLADTFRKPLALLAATATLAAGVALEAPAVAAAQPAGANLVAGQEQSIEPAASTATPEHNDSSNWPWAVAALAVTYALAMSMVSRYPNKDSQ